MLKSKHSGWTWNLKRTPFGGGGGFISSITDPISSALGTDGGGGGLLGGLAQLDKGVNQIPGGWYTVGGLAAGGTAIAFAPEIAAAIGAGEGAQITTAAGQQAFFDSLAAGGSGAEAASAGLAADTAAAGGAGGAAASGLTPAEIAAGTGTPSTSGLAAGSAFTPQEIAAGQGVQGIGANLAGTAGGNIPAGFTAGAGAAGGLMSGLGGNLGTALGVSAGANALGSLLGANASNKAAQIQANAANNASQLTANMFNIQNQQQQPYRTAGYGALNNINALSTGPYTQYDASGNPIGTGAGSGYLQHQFNAQDLNANMSPGYAFQLEQGQRANQNAANALGGRVGGNALQGLQNYTQGLAQTSYQNAFSNYQAQRQNIYNTLAGIAGIGQTSQQQTGNLAQNANTTQAQLGVGSAAAQAAGQTGVASALTGGATGVANNLLLASLLGQNQSAAGA